MEQPATLSVQRLAFRDYLQLCKPRVVSLIIFTAVVGMFLATPDMVPLNILLFATVGIGFAAASGAAINHLVDSKIDALMGRTQSRPLPSGRLERHAALVFALGLCALGMLILVLFVNILTAILTLLSMVGYAVVYSVFLKRATPQNIVIGGAAGAMPPVLGWTAVTGYLDPHSLLLFLIIFAWTPPHFWALAIHRRSEYAKAEIPMLPVTHGVEFTRIQILLYTVIMCVVSVLPFITGMSGIVYLVGALGLGGGFLYYSVALYGRQDETLPMRTFRYSIIYLAGMFTLLLLDHYLV